MAREGKRNAKIVFVSSTLGFMSFVGWSSYSPAKHALRGISLRLLKRSYIDTSSIEIGLAEALRSELILYNIDVHIYFPATMFTPGYEEENKTKPKITMEIEGADDGMTADQAALVLFTGLLFRSSSYHNFLNRFSRRREGTSQHYR